MNRLQKELVRIDKDCSRELAMLRNERGKKHGGGLTLLKRHGKTYYYEQTGKKKKGIGKDRARVYELARAKHLDLKIAQLEQNQKLVREALDFLKGSKACRDPEAYIRERFGDTDLVLKNVLWNEEQLKASSLGNRNTYRKEELQYRTNGGVPVRSLSEQSIGNLYEELEIPYCYEGALTVDVTPLGRVPGSYESGGRIYKTYFPDFMVFLADGSVLVHEHLGLADDEGYRIHNSEKLMAYTCSGAIDMSHLLFTYPDDVKDTSRLREYLINHVKPYV